MGLQPLPLVAVCCLHNMLGGHTSASLLPGHLPLPGRRKPLRFGIHIAASSPGASLLLQRVAQEAAAVCDQLYGVGSCPQDVEDFDAAAALVLR